MSSESFRHFCISKSSFVAIFLCVHTDHWSRFVSFAMENGLAIFGPVTEYMAILAGEHTNI